MFQWISRPVFSAIRCASAVPDRRSSEPLGEGRPMTRLLPLSAVLLAAVVLVGCDNKPAANEPQLPAVTVSRPLEKKITEWDEYTGRFVAVKTVEVRARVSGFINSIHFKDG